MYRDDLKYTKTHEWVLLYKNNIARVGVTDFAQQYFGNVLFVELPELDGEHEQFDSLVIIEAENMLSEVYSPLSGKVITINEEIDHDPTIINHDPYDEGWILELEIMNDNEIESLMDYDEYQEFLESGENEE
jgi:glycine cleavage system H protein